MELKHLYTLIALVEQEIFRCRGDLSISIESNPMDNFLCDKIEELSSIKCGLKHEIQSIVNSDDLIMDIIKNLYNNNRKILAIKKYKEYTGLSLIESKKYLENIDVRETPRSS